MIYISRPEHIDQHNKIHCHECQALNNSPYHSADEADAGLSAYDEIFSAISQPPVLETAAKQPVRTPQLSSPSPQRLNNKTDPKKKRYVKKRAEAQ